MPPFLQSSRGLSLCPNFCGKQFQRDDNFPEYDKAVETDQRILRDLNLTPAAVCKWKTTYDIDANDPARRMTMAQAFGDVSLLCLGMMFPDDTAPMDDAGFDEYQNF